MAHPQQLEFVALVRRHLIPDVSAVEVLEIGAYNVTGSVRGQFSGCAGYVGVDLIAGPGVDVVCAGQDLPLDTGRFGVTVSCECLEHSPQWLEVFQNMIRMTKPGGLVIFTCASRGRLEHGTRRTCPGASPGTQAVGLDYYRNLNARDFRRKMSLADQFDLFRFYYCRPSSDLYFFGVKRGVESASFDLSALERGIRLIDQLGRTPLTLRERFATIHSEYPLRILSYLVADHTYQDVALAYQAGKDRIKRYLTAGRPRL